MALFLYRTRAPFTQHVRRGYAALTGGEENVGNGGDREANHSGQARIEARYQDEPNEDTDTRDNQERSGHAEAQRRDSNLVLQPSSIREQGNEWMD